MIWADTTLGDVASSIQTGPFGSQLHSSDYSDEGTPVIMPQDIVEWVINESKIARVEDVHVNRLKRHKCDEGDIIYPRRGDLAKCAYISNREKGWLCGTGCLKVTIDPTLANPKYVFFQLQQPYSISCIEMATVGSTMPNLNTSILSKVKLRLPSLELQDRIVNILSDYDNLIEVNRKRITILEEMAMRTYREWFVHFRFPGYESVDFIDGFPKGWIKSQAQEFFDITIGKTPSRKEIQWFAESGSGVPWLSISDMKDRMFLYSTSEDLTEEAVKKHNMVVVEPDTILLSFKLTVGRVGISTVPMCTNEAIAHCKSEKPSFREYTYCYLKNFQFDSLGSTSSIANAINSKTVKKMPFICPTEKVLKEFSRVMSPVFNSIRDIQMQNCLLQQMRDKLLPQLMSGQIEISI